MNYLKIDHQKCKKDGFCIRECPMNILRFSGDDGYPELIPEGEKICIECGHCVVVCPHGALDHEKVPAGSCVPLRSELIITGDEAVQFLRSRRSVRLYRDKPVEKEKIELLIDVASSAPTSGNSQLVEWLVIGDKTHLRRIASLAAEWLRQILQDSPELVRTLPYLPKIVQAWDKGIDSLLRGAPALIVASAPAEAANGMVDLTLALSYVDLFAPALGLGTCWAGLLQRALLHSNVLKKEVGIPVRHPHHYPMMLGYPAVKYYRLPVRKPPRINFK